jgi:signal transduction histidine kinase
MTRRTVVIASRALLALGIAASIAAFALNARIQDRLEPGRIAVVGDVHAPEMRQVLDELRVRVATGEPLTGGLSAGPGVALTLLILIWLATGVLIVSRQPGNVAGWIFCVIGVAWPVALLSGALAVYGIRVDPGSVPAVGVAAVLNDTANVPIALLPLLFLLCPDGHAPSRRWRRVEQVFLASLGIALLGYVLSPGPLNNLVESGIVYQNPLGIDALGGLMGGITGGAGLVALITAVACVLSIRGRYRRAEGELRQQLRWLYTVGSVAGVLFVLLFVGSIVLDAVRPDGSEVPIFPIMLGALAVTVAAGVPAAYLVAIYRYRLWDLDVVIRKAVVLAVLAGFISLLYAGVTLLPLAVIGSRGGGDLQGVVFGGTVVLVLLFQPVRQRARRFADRVVYGERATPYEVLSEFSGRLGEAYATDDVLPRTARVLVDATGASSAVVWLRVGGELRPGATWPAGPMPQALEVRGDGVPGLEGHGAVEVRHQGELLGALSVTMPPNDPLDPQRDRMIHDLAGQAGLVLRNVRLIEDLRASRQRLVAAQDEERRKIERDLHDGAQQQLVALTVQLKLAGTMLARDPARALALLDGLQGTAGDALEDLRQLARGIYPPLLADKGLAAALGSQAQRAAIPTTVEATAVGRYDRAVESAVYFCALDALNNVAKYAGACRAEVSLREVDGQLEFRVHDDGAGFDPGATRYGTGLLGMADRLDAVGGVLEVVSAAGAGTTVTGRIPARAREVAAS